MTLVLQLPYHQVGYNIPPQGWIQWQMSRLSYPIHPTCRGFHSRIVTYDWTNPPDRMCFYLFLHGLFGPRLVKYYRSVGGWTHVFVLKFYLPILGAREDVSPFWRAFCMGGSTGRCPNRPPLTVGNYNIILMNLTCRGHPAYNMDTWTLQNGKWMVKHRWLKQRKWKEHWSKAEDISFEEFWELFQLVHLWMRYFYLLLEDCWNMDRLRFAPIKFGPNHFQWVSTGWGRANRGWKLQVLWQPAFSEWVFIFSVS